MRIASPLEQAWLERRHQITDTEGLVVMSEAGSARWAVAFAVRSMKWLRHDFAQTKALDEALRPGLEGLVAHADGTVTAGNEVLGQADADHARRWVLAYKRLVFS